MEAATQQQQRAIEGEKAQRIVDAMRSSVARRGVAGSTFDHVAREARVSRGLLHYYFGTKERLLAEVVASLKRYVEEEPEFITVVFELFTLSRRNEEIASEFAELLRRTREHVADLLARKQAEGALHLRAEPEAVADVLFSLADGICLRMLTETDHDFARTLDAGVLAVRALLD